MDIFPRISDGFIHTLWEQNIIHANLDLFIQYLVYITKQDSDGHPILDHNIDSLRQVAQDLFNRRGCTTGHYSVIFDEGDTISFGRIW